MTIIIRDETNTPRTVTEIIVRDETNTPRTISEIWVRDTTNTPRLVFSTASTLAAVASDYNVFGYESGTGTAISNSTTITPSGGTAPYTYAWTVVSYNAGVSPTVNLPTAATTAFTQTSMGPGDYFVAVFRCTVTDAALNTVDVDVNGSFYSFA